MLFHIVPQSWGPAEDSEELGVFPLVHPETGLASLWVSFIPFPVEDAMIKDRVFQTQGNPG